MDHSRRMSINFIAMDNHHTVQLFKVGLESSFHARSGMALQRGKNKFVCLVMRYYIVDVAVAEIAHTIKQDNILTVI